MEVKFFTETYEEEYGSVFAPASSGILEDVSGFDNCDIVDESEILDSLADYKTDDGYQSFMNAVEDANTIIVFSKDGIRPGDIGDIYQIVIE